MTQVSRFLVGYSAVVTGVFVLTVLIGFARPLYGSSHIAEFDRIRVHRIDIVEPDGTERLILSNRTDYPGSFFHNKEVARPDRRDAAGLLMMNDEGSEDGGFIWGGLSREGKPMSFSHLSFDQYQQDQTLALDASLEEGMKFTSIRINDVPDYPLTEEVVREAARVKEMPLGAERDAALAALRKKFPAAHRRISLAREDDGSVGLELNDAAGRPRLRMIVDASGNPQIDFLAEDGRVVRTVQSR